MLFLTGDTSTDPGGTIPGIQPCPLCSAGTCIGGPNNGMACAPGTSALQPGVSDQPRLPAGRVGQHRHAAGRLLASPAAPSPGRGTAATNDTGSTASNQTRVFSGFCRDLPDGTGGFEGTIPATAELCWENGMAVGTALQPAPSRAASSANNGAFGPNGGDNRTIRAIGSATSILGGPAPATLVSVFTIRPTFDATVDTAGDLPGPGAVALPGTADALRHRRVRARSIPEPTSP